MKKIGTCAESRFPTISGGELYPPAEAVRRDILVASSKRRDSVRMSDFVQGRPLDDFDRIRRAVSASRKL